MICIVTYIEFFALYKTIEVIGRQIIDKVLNASINSFIGVKVMCNSVKTFLLHTNFYDIFELD